MVRLQRQSSYGELNIERSQDDGPNISLQGTGTQLSLQCLLVCFMPDSKPVLLDVLS